MRVVAPDNLAGIQESSLPRASTRSLPGGVGFTLVEVVACLMIVGLLVSMVVISLTGVRQIHVMNDVVDRLQMLDQQARVQARRFDRKTELKFNVTEQVVESRLGGDGDVMGQNDARWGILTGFSLTDVRLHGSQEDWDQGQVAVPFTAEGYGPTYALHLSARRGEERFLVFAGLSGHMWSSESKERVDAVFALLEP